MLRRRRAALGIIVSAIIAVTGAVRAQPAEEPAAPQPPAQAPAPAPAQGEGEIRDPELDGPQPAAAPEAPPPAAAQGAEGDAGEIWDPELDRKRPEAPPTTPRPDTATGDGDSFGTKAASTEVRGFLATRVGVDTDWTTPREEVIEATQVAQLEMIHHPSDSFGIGVGLRARHILAIRRPEEPGESSRTGLDVVPIAGFVDMNVGDSGHLRAGYQIIELGRFDIFSASNFLAVHDLRSGPVTMPEANYVAQPAVRLDIDPVDSVTLTGIYVPFFTPHIVDLVGSDYSPLAVVQSTPVSTDPLAEALENAIGRSESTEGSRAILRALAPDPDLLEPQGAVRATWRGAPGEISATAGTALEHVPALGFSDAFLTSLDTLMPPADAAGLIDLLTNPPAFELIYNRFFVTSVDAATDVGPVQLGLEVAYMFDRTFTAASRAPLAGPPSQALPVPGQTDVLQLALRAELVEGEGFVTFLEGFGALALDDPADSRRRWLTLDEDNRMYGVAGGFQWTLGSTGLMLELGGALLNGPTYAAIPRIEWEALEGFFLEVGALAFGGKDTPITAPNASLGTYFEGTDQVFTGVRWVP